MTIIYLLVLLVSCGVSFLVGYKVRERRLRSMPILFLENGEPAVRLSCDNNGHLVIKDYRKLK